ncbi:MAG: hypothetical protein M3Y72_03475 [Acidobacteriota bacterium]|nr:hypothetical protein [Acidobacteriota bacterium]
MPAQPTWFPRLTQIVADLRAMNNVLVIDRHAFERLFQVRDRRARVLMSRFAGIQIGNAWAVDRQQLIETLEAIQRGEEFQWEQRRRKRIAAIYEQAKREHPARQVQIPITKETRTRTVSSLPSGVKLSRCELHIQFSNAEDLAGKLFELSQAMARDWDAFARAAEES